MILHLIYFFSFSHPHGMAIPFIFTFFIPILLYIIYPKLVWYCNFKTSFCLNTSWMNICKGLTWWALTGKSDKNFFDIGKRKIAYLVYWGVYGFTAGWRGLGVIMGCKLQHTLYYICFEHLLILFSTLLGLGFRV